MLIVNKVGFLSSDYRFLESELPDWYSDLENLLCAKNHASPFKSEFFVTLSIVERCEALVQIPTDFGRVWF